MIRECGARTKTNGHKPCRRIAHRNGKCYLHGGATPTHNPGPKTEAGKLRQKMGSWKHGRRSRESIEEARFLRGVIKEGKDLILQMNSLK